MSSASFRAALAALTFAAALVTAGPAGAQDPVVVATGGQVARLAIRSLPISAEQVRTMLSSNFATEFQDGAAAYHVLLVVDANDQFVRGKVTPATVISGDSLTPGVRRAFAMGDSAAGVVVSGAGPARAFITMSKTEGSVQAAGAAGGILGSGVSVTDIGSIGMTSFKAGEVADAPVVVQVVKLK